MTRIYLLCGLFCFVAVAVATGVSAVERTTSSGTAPVSRDIMEEAEIYAMFMHATQLEETNLNESEKVYLAIIARDPDAAYVHFKLALLYWRKGDREKTAEFFEKAIEKDPQLKEAYSYYGLVKRIGGDHKGAFEIYERAVENLDDDLDIYKTLAEAYAFQGEKEKELDTWIRATGEHPLEPETWINVIRLNLSLGRHEKARAVYEKALETTGGSTRFLDGSRDIYFAVKDKETANEITLELIKKRPTSLRLWADHISYLLEEGMTNEAEQALEGAETHLGHRVDFYVAMGKLLAEKGLDEKALEILESGMEVKPDDSELLLSLSTMYARQGNSEKAREYYERLLRIQPDSPEYYIRIADSLEADGFTEKALETYLKAKERLPKSKELRRRIIAVLLKLDMQEEAVKELEEAASIYPDDLAFQITYITFLRIDGKHEKALEYALALMEETRTPQTLSLVAAVYSDSKEYAKSAEYLEEAIALSGDADVGDYLTLARAYKKAGMEEKAEESFSGAIAILEKVLERDKTNYQALYALGIVYEEKGDKEKAGEYNNKVAEELKKRVEAPNPSPEIMLIYADFMQNMDDIEEAEKYYLLAIDKGEDEATAMNNLGYMWIDRGINVEEGLAYVKRALEIEPDNPAFIDSLGWGYYRLGKYEEALVELKRAAEAGDENAEILDHLGDAYMKNNMFEQAIDYWRRALEMDPPNSEEIKNKIDDIKRKMNE